MSSARASGRLAWALAAVLACGAAAAETQAPAPREGDEVVWHTVKPGETLEEITRSYLGTPLLWPENWKLNPDIANPHKLTPGQRIRVIKYRPATGREADVSKVERKVERKPNPDDWTVAKTGDRLKPRDGIRTYERSSAQLDFDDGSTLVLSESSLVFLKEAGRSVSGVNRQSLEIVEGQSDIKAPQARGRSSEIEIVFGGSSARPEPQGGRPAQARARLEKTGEAQLMVYTGKSELRAGDATVSVGEGMGSSVPKGGAPRTPETLLSAPQPIAPPSGAALAFTTPLFTWNAVPGAAGYVVEVCRDAACGLLVERRTGLTALETRFDALPEGNLYWRVGAVSATGLDGFPASPVPFSVRGSRPDREPPAVAVAPSGAARADGDRAIRLGEAGTLVLSAADDVSGVAELRYRWDGGAWQKATAGTPVPAPAGPGPFALEVVATDHAGRVSPGLAVTVSR